MRIFVTCQDQTGSPKTIRLNVNEAWSTNQLLIMISREFRLKKQLIIVKLKNQIIAVDLSIKQLRIVQNWPLSAYPIKNGSRLQVDLVGGSQDSPSQSPFQSPVSRSLTKIEEQLEIEADKQYESSLSQQKKSESSTLQQNQGFAGIDEQGIFEESLSRFLAAIRQKSLEKVSEILKEEPQIIDEKHYDKIMNKKTKYLLDQLGECGKSSIHWAIHQNDLDMLEFLLIKSANPNVISLDQYTPLQLSIDLRLSNIFQTLIEHPKIDVNMVTSKGTALHVAIKIKQKAFIQKLIEKGADLDIADNQNKTCRELCTEMKIDISSIKDSGRVLIPYIDRGRIYKVSTFSYRLKLRLLLINPYTNEFIVYNEEKAVEDIFKISMIKSVQMVRSRAWLMKKQYFYFQVITEDDKFLFAAHHQQISQKWVEQIKIAKKFVSRETPALIKKSQQLIQAIDDINNEIKIHKKKANEKVDKMRVSIFQLKPALEEEEESQPNYSIQVIEPKEPEEKGISQKLTSSMMAPSEMESSEAGDLRESNLLGSVVQEKNFRFPPKQHERKGSNDFMYGSILSTSMEGPIPDIGFKDFQILRELGNGSFGKVFLARHEKSQRLYALKVLSKKKLMAKKQLKYALGEANILKKVDNPFIVQLYYSFQTPTYLYMALDYCPYGDLTQLLCDQVRLSEATCKFYIAQLILAIQYLHQNKIIYRDLKPQNILIAKNGFIKLTDFGLSKQKNFATSFCGSPAYLSPEMLEKKGVGFEADLYGIGCVLYEMLAGEPPYFDDDLTTLFENIKNGKLKYPPFISKPAKALISSLLERDMKKRIGANGMSQIKEHEFFKNFEWKRLSRMQMNLPAELITRFSENEQMNLQVIKQSRFKDIDYDGPNVKINRIRGFNFIKQSLLTEE